MTDLAFETLPAETLDESAPARRVRLGPFPAAVLTTILAGALAGLMAMAGNALADPMKGDEGCRGLGDKTECLVVMIDHLRRIELTDDAKTVLIGNPAVADVNMVSKSHAILAARTVGATNLIFLDDEGKTIGDFEVVVRETEQRRVVLRRGPGAVELYQCAPRCERTLTQLDSDKAHSLLSAQIDRENRLNAAAEGAAASAAPAAPAAVPTN